MIEIGKVYNCDCIDGMREMLAQGLTVQMTLTDIPYDCVNKQADIKHFKKALRNWHKGDADILKFDLSEFLELVEQLTKNSVVIFCGMQQLSGIKQFFIDKGWATRVIVWEKTNPAPIGGKYNYLSGLELAVFAKKAGATFNAYCKNTVFRFPCSVNDIHPTMKSMPLWIELVKDLTNEGDTIFDPCMGSFTTAVVAHRMSRRFIGFELNADYYARGLKRLQAVQSQLSMFDLEGGYGNTN